PLRLQRLRRAFDGLLGSGLDVGHVFGDVGQRRVDVEIPGGRDVRGGSRHGLLVDDALALFGLGDGIDFFVLVAVMDMVRRRHFVVVVLVVVLVLGAGDAGMLEDVFVIVLGRGHFERTLGLGAVLGRQGVGRGVDGSGVGRGGRRVDGLLLLLVGDFGLGARSDLEGFDVVFGTAAGFRLLFGDQRLPVGDRD